MVLGILHYLLSTRLEPLEKCTHTFPNIVLLYVMPLTITIHECSAGELLTSVAFKHHADPMGLMHYRKVGMMNGSNIAE